MHDPSQEHHDCLTMDEEDLWIRYYEKVKERLNIKNNLNHV